MAYCVIKVLLHAVNMQLMCPGQAHHFLNTLDVFFYRSVMLLHNGNYCTIDVMPPTERQSVREAANGNCEQDRMMKQIAA